MSEVWSFDIGDLVWAKMRGSPAWPGCVVDPPDKLRRKSQKNWKCIYFFGSDNNAWIEVKHLKPYFVFKDTLSYRCRTPKFKEACKKIEEFINE